MEGLGGGGWGDHMCRCYEGIPEKNPQCTKDMSQRCSVLKLFTS